MNSISKNTNDTSKTNHKNNELYKYLLLEEYIYIIPSELDKNIDDIILSKLKKKNEGKCYGNYGYIIPNTVEIKKRSSGLINNSSFDGKITYKVNYIANVCKPVDNIIVECIVISIDKSQIICYIDDKKTSPLEIYLFKHNHQGNDEFLNLKEGDIINVKIGGSKSQHKDTQIVCIAEYLDKV